MPGVRRSTECTECPGCFLGARFVRELKTPEFSPAAEGGLAERRSVADQDTPFDNIEGSHEYVALLAEAIEEARREIEAEIALAEREEAERRKEALLLVAYNLGKLEMHIRASRRILNDLRTLRRLLLDERGPSRAQVERAASSE